MTGVLVVEDGSSPYVLAAVRSLSRAGYRVDVGSPRPNPRVVSSRACSAWHQVRLPEDDLDGFVDDVRSAVARGGHALVVGADDVELLALSARRDEVPALFPHAPHEAVLRAVDKLALTEAALRVGVAAPATAPATAQALAAVDGPVVVKARLHWTPGASSAGAGRHLLVAMAPDADAATERVREIEAGGGSAVLQEPVHGEQVALSLVVDQDGQPAAWSQQRTVLSSLARTSVRAETVAVDAELLEGSVALLRELGWTGLANLQFLRPPGGRPHVIDLNGRYYGSLGLAVGAGADLPAVWAGLALGRPVSRPQVGRPGVRFHAVLPDLQRARAQRRGGLGRDALGVLAYAPGAVHSTWSVRDPRPGLGLALGLVRRRVG